MVILERTRKEEEDGELRLSLVLTCRAELWYSLPQGSGRVDEEES